MTIISRADEDNTRLVARRFVMLTMSYLDDPKKAKSRTAKIPLQNLYRLLEMYRYDAFADEGRRGVLALDRSTGGAGLFSDHNVPKWHVRIEVALKSAVDATSTVHRQQKHSRYDIPFGKTFLLHPGALALVPTLEWVKLPQELQGVVTARSSWAREGLNIATATIVNPGYTGIITLELANFGQIPIKLYPGLRLAQIAFYRLEVADAKADLKHLGGKFKFNGNFEPSAGNIAQDDEAFLR